VTKKTSEANTALRGLNWTTLHRLAWVGRVRPDERADVLGALLTLLGFMAGHAVLETARDALFLASLPARRLPWVYFAIALLALAIGHREPRVVRRMSARNELGRWLLAAAAVTAVFWIVVGSGRTWILYALYVWSGVIASLVVVRFWTLLASRFTVTQAKRVFPVIASGSVAGAILGSALARIVAEMLPPRHLVLVAAGAFLVASAAPALLQVQDAEPRRRTQWGELGDVGREIVSRPYLLRLTVMVLLATVTFTLVDFVFKSSSDRLIPPEELGEFFASAYLAFNIASLLVQVLVVPWLLRQFGLVSAVVFVPAILLASSLGFVAAGGLAFAVVLKGTDGALRHSLHRTGTELLFVPLSDQLRAQVKGVIDVLGQRGGQALASIVILMLLSTPAGERTFAVLACLTSAAWLLVAFGMREHYLDLFRQTLQPESRSSRTPFPSLDVASVETLLATLNSPDDRRVIAALDLLESQGRGAVVPPPILYHPSSRVVTRSLDLFSATRSEAAESIVPRLVAHPDAEVRAAALRALSVLGPDRTAFEQALSDTDPRVAATARASLVACAWDGSGEHEMRLLEEVPRASPEVKLSVAAALCARASARLEPLVLDLIEDEDPAVAGMAIRAAAALGTPAMVDALIRCLGRRAVRTEARSALTGYGPLALARLSEALASETLGSVIRSQLPAAIASIGTPQVPAILLRRLGVENDGLVRFKILRAMGRWRREQPSFPLDRFQLGEALTTAVSTGFQFMAWRHALVGEAQRDPQLKTELHDVLVALLRDKQDHALERAFRLLNLQAGGEEFQRVYLSLHSPLPQSRAGSRELLEHMVVPPVRGPLLTLVDDLHGESRPEPPRSELMPGHYQDVLAGIIVCGIESASSLAAAHAAELRMAGLGDVIRETAPVSEEHAQTLAGAIAAMEGVA
jgi:HEAT repeat protein